MNNFNNSNREQQLLTWTQIISDCKSAKTSGTKVKDYLKVNGISKDTYYYWYREVKDSFTYVFYSGTNDTTFPATPSPSVRPSSSLKLSINGISIEVNELTNPEFLTNIIKAVHYA